MGNSESNDQNHRTYAGDDEVDLGELLRVLWAEKWLIGGITISSTVIAIVIALILPNIYRAEALLAPNQDEGAGGLSALAAQYGGLASLAGINLESGTSDKTALGLEVLKSRKFISDFIDRHDILVPLMATDSWDAKSGAIEIDPDIYDASAQEWVRSVRPPRKLVPSRQEAYEEFSRNALSISKDEKTGFVTVSVEHRSPTIAKQWVDWLVEDINATVMRQDVDEAEQAIEYLNKQIAATSLAELQHVFFRLIEDQTKTVMLAKVSPEYLFRTIDPAVAPERRAKPQRALIAVLGLFVGGMIGVIVVFARKNMSGGQG